MSKNSKKFSMSLEQRRARHFSESLKQKIVRDCTAGLCQVSQICKTYEVSATSVYRWIYLYSQKQKPTRLIMEEKSDTAKILALQKKIAELERLVGQKQILIDFQDKMIEIAENMYQVDIKKKFGNKP